MRKLLSTLSGKIAHRVINARGGFVPKLLKAYYPNADVQARILDSGFSKAVIGKETLVTNSQLSNNCTIGESCKLRGVNLTGIVKIGRFTSLWGPGIEVNSHHYEVEIGNFCSVARNTSIYEYNHPTDRVSSYFMMQNVFGLSLSDCIESKGAVKIGNDVWIGVNSVILSGVEIGNGSVIAAGSVVTRNVPPYAIVAGVPAKILRFRFPPNVIEEFSDIKWWDWPINKILRNQSFFSGQLDINQPLKDQFVEC